MDQMVRYLCSDCIRSVERRLFHSIPSQRLSYSHVCRDDFDSRRSLVSAFYCNRKSAVRTELE